MRRDLMRVGAGEGEVREEGARACGGGPRIQPTGFAIKFSFPFETE